VIAVPDGLRGRGFLLLRHGGVALEVDDGVCVDVEVFELVRVTDGDVDSDCGLAAAAQIQVVVHELAPAIHRKVVYMV
jgi:hypothetical protein